VASHGRPDLTYPRLTDHLNLAPFSYAALTLSTGRQYYISLKNAPRCAKAGNYLSFGNSTCSASSNGKPAAPALSSGSSKMRQWTVSIKGKQSDGSYIVSLANFVPPRAAKPRCVGKIGVEKPSACSGSLVERVKIHPNSLQCELDPLFLSCVCHHTCVQLLIPENFSECSVEGCSNKIWSRSNLCST
jgi:hypothetical protein